MTDPLFLSININSNGLYVDGRGRNEFHVFTRAALTNYIIMKKIAKELSYFVCVMVFVIACAYIVCNNDGVHYQNDEVRPLTSKEANVIRAAVGDSTLSPGEVFDIYIENVEHWNDVLSKKNKHK